MDGSGIIVATSSSLTGCIRGHQERERVNDVLTEMLEFTDNRSAVM